jgi:hypothetical protein
MQNEPNFRTSLKFQVSSVKQEKPSHGPKALCAKRTQFRPSRPPRPPTFQYSSPQAWDVGQLCKTNPIPGPAGWDGAGGAWGVGQSRETKPNLGAPGVSGDRRAGGAYRAKQSQFTSGTRKTIAKAFGLDAATRHRGKCAKRTQFPAVPGGMRPGGRGTWAKCAKRSQFPALPRGTRPEARATRAKCAKRTQFPPLGRGEPPSFHYSIIPPCQSPANRAKRTQFGQARPGSGGRLCETNPIPGYAGRAEAGGTWDGGQMRKTNPICWRCPAALPRPSALRRGRLCKTCKTNPILEGV